MSSFSWRLSPTSRCYIFLNNPQQNCQSQQEVLTCKFHTLFPAHHGLFSISPILIRFQMLGSWHSYSKGLWVIISLWDGFLLHFFLSDSWTAFWKSKNGSWIAWELAKINNNEPILSTLKWTDYHCKLLLIWIFDGKRGFYRGLSPASGTDFMVWQRKHFCRLHLYFFFFLRF